MTGCVPTWRTRRCGWPGCWRRSHPTSPRSWDSRRCWRSKARECRARIDEHGEPVLLEAQDRSRWDPLLIRRGLAALRQAELLAARGKPVGKYFLQASIASQHARAQRAEDTDWRQIATVVRRAGRGRAGPVVEVNRAVAHGRAFGPDAGLAVLEEVDADELGDSPLLPSVRGDLLERAGRHAEAGEAFTEAAAAPGTRASERCCNAAPSRTSRAARRRADRSGPAAVRRW